MRARASIAGVIVAACVACSEPVAPPTVAPPTPSPPVQMPAAEASELEAELTALAATELVADAPAPPTDGIWIVRHPDGTVAAEGPMRAGRRDGVWRRFDHDGLLVEEGTYAEDRPIGVWTLHGSDGVWRETVTYSDVSCAERPVLPLVTWCGTSGRAPVDVAHSGGAGELRRCVAWSSPWIAEALAGEREGRDRLVDALSRAQSPELTQRVHEEVRAIVARYVEEGRPASSAAQVFAALAAAGVAERRDPTWVQDQALQVPEIVGGLSLRLDERAAGSAGFAARWYLAVVAAHDAAPEEPGSSVRSSLARDAGIAARAIADHRPELALAIDQDAIDRLAEHPFHVAELRLHRAEILVSHGDYDAADREAALAEATYATQGAHLLPRTDRLRARIAAARGDTALAATHEARAAERDARIAAEHAEGLALAAVLESARASSEQGRHADAAAAIEAVIARGDQAGDAPGTADWGAMLRLHAARARLALGERERARALIAAGMAREERSRHAPFLQTLAEIELASGRAAAARVAARDALARLEALGMTMGAYHDELEALVARTDAAAGL